MATGCRTVVLGVVRPPALDRDLGHRKGGILDRLDEFGQFLYCRESGGRLRCHREERALKRH